MPLQSQRTHPTNATVVLDEFRVYQITVDELEQRTQLHFPATLTEDSTALLELATAERKPLAATTDITW